ncbi:hypothetical protein BDN72DRAFT_107338 [Pluteus cervinus]|uniref:Uncharacterized protein n=1 Tax=Pluteus cervinus TaxID=181527 RepID=A0ACD3AP79_9AGAR|nr:hypothetical protein BDN72DRAFT_107338 [Pluteus cervinus]
MKVQIPLPVGHMMRTIDEALLPQGLMIRCLSSPEPVLVAGSLCCTAVTFGLDCTLLGSYGPGPCRSNGNRESIIQDPSTISLRKLRMRMPLASLGQKPASFWHIAQSTASSFKLQASGSTTTPSNLRVITRSKDAGCPDSPRAATFYGINYYS